MVLARLIAIMSVASSASKAWPRGQRGSLELAEIGQGDGLARAIKRPHRRRPGPEGLEPGLLARQRQASLAGPEQDEVGVELDAQRALVAADAAMQRRRRFEVLRRLVQAAVVGGIDALGVAAFALDHPVFAGHGERQGGIDELEEIFAIAALVPADEAEEGDAGTLRQGVRQRRDALDDVVEGRQRAELAVASALSNSRSKAASGRPRASSMAAARS